MLIAVFDHISILGTNDCVEIILESLILDSVGAIRVATQHRTGID